MKNIILTGLMGSGKSSVAICLKKIFSDFELVETDVLIIQKEGASINNIFEEKGEKYFRTIEKQIIDDVLKKENQIISLGGGSLENDFDFELCKKKSIMFYLKADSDTLYERLKTANDRPLLKCENPKEKLQQLLEIREKNYLKADFIIDVNNIDIVTVSKKIGEIYKNANRNNKS